MSNKRTTLKAEKVKGWKTDEKTLPNKSFVEIPVPIREGTVEDNEC